MLLYAYTVVVTRAESLYLLKLTVMAERESTNDSTLVDALATICVLVMSERHNRGWLLN